MNYQLLESNYPYKVEITAHNTAMMLLPSGNKINVPVLGVQTRSAVSVGAPAFIIHLLTSLSEASGETPLKWINPHTSELHQRKSHRHE